MMMKLAVLIFCLTVLSVAHAQYYQRRQSYDSRVQQDAKDSGPSLVVGVMISSAAYYPKTPEQEKFVQEIIERYFPKQVEHHFVQSDRNDEENTSDFQSTLNKVADSSEKNNEDDFENVQNNSNLPVVSDESVYQHSLDQTASNTGIQSENIDVNVDFASKDDLNNDPNIYHSSDQIISGSQTGDSISNNQQSEVVEHDMQDAINPLVEQGFNPLEQQDDISSAVDNDLVSGVPEKDTDNNEGSQLEIGDPSQQVVGNNIALDQKDNLDLSQNNRNVYDKGFSGIDSDDDPSKEAIMSSKNSIMESKIQAYNPNYQPYDLMHWNHYTKHNLDYYSNAHFKSVPIKKKSNYMIKVPLNNERDPCSALYVIILGRRSLCKDPEILKS